MTVIFFIATAAGAVSWTAEKDYEVVSLCYANAGATGQVLLSANPTLTTAQLSTSGWRDDVIAHAVANGAGAQSLQMEIPNFPVAGGTTLFAYFSAAGKATLYLAEPVS